MQKAKLRKMFLWIIYILILLYLGFVLLCFLGQKRVIYPASQTPLSACDFPDGVELFAERVNDQHLDGITHKTGARKLLVFFHGNGETACDARFLGPNQVAQYGYDTLAVEYPGYASTDGELGIRANEQMVEATATWLKEQDYDEVTVIGYSLGTAMASMLAPKINAKTVLLFAPFDRMRRVIRDHAPMLPPFIITENYKSDTALQGFKGEVIIVYGAKDVGIFPKRSLALAGTIPQANVIEVKEAGHEDLLNDEFFNPILQEFL